MAQDPVTTASFLPSQSMTLDELRAAQGARPTFDLSELRADVFESDDELAAFLAELRPGGSRPRDDSWWLTS